MMKKKIVPRDLSGADIVAHADVVSRLLSKIIARPMDRMAVLLFAMVNAAFDQVTQPKLTKKRKRISKAKRAKQR